MPLPPRGPALRLAPEAKGLLELVRAAKQPSYSTLGAVEARRRYRLSSMFMQGAVPEVGSVVDRVIDGPGGPLTLRLYRPLSAPDDEALPALVYLHGGGWTLGDLDTHDGVCRGLAAAARCAVVAVDYRLAPEHKFPAALEDAAAATRYVAREAAALHLDPRRLAVGGDSAGGNLAAAVALTLRDEGGPPLLAQVLCYPATVMGGDFPSMRELADGHMLTLEAIEWFRACYVRGPQDRQDWRCSPLLAPDLSRLPAAIVLTAGFDPLRDEGEAYADRLREAGVEVTYACYEGMLHDFLIMGRMLPAAAAVVDEIGAALRRRLTLPAARPSRVAAALTGSALVRSLGRPLSQESPVVRGVVIAVDDEADNLDLVARSLPQYRVHGFTDPAAALQAAIDAPPVAMVVDYRMPNMNGIELVRRCRERGLGFPVVMVTAFRDLDEVAFAQSSNLVYQVVPKPFEPSRLHDWTALAIIRSHTPKT